jgi:aminoglycoside phosphotransferase (APT) family kinase protein
MHASPSPLPPLRPQSNPTYLLTLGGKRLVLRKQPPGELLASAHAVDREYRVLRALSATAVPVPRPLLLCSDPTILGTQFYVMEFAGACSPPFKNGARSRAGSCMLGGSFFA